MARGRRREAAEPGAALARAAQAHAPRPRRVLVAFSGGPDSTLLLAHALEYWPRRRVAAVHVHHGWHGDADAWADHCRRQARALGTRCEVVRVDARPRAGEGPEAGARGARYAALAARLGREDVLLTAHHREDQAETLLLALLRGGGVHGWAGMPARRRLGHGVHLRPWLGVSRAAIRAELERRGLDWVDDPANADTGYDRAWLRNEILPRLRTRWPRVDATLARAADQAGDAAAGVDALAARDFVACRGPVTDTLEVAALARLPQARQRALLRWWLARAGLPRPPAARLETLRTQLVQAAPGRSPRVAWPGGEVRGWQGLAWALHPLAPVDADRVHPWPDRGRPLELPGRRLEPAELEAMGIRPAPAARVEVRFPRGGERFRPAGAARAESLRELLRRRRVPPWQRARTPLVYVDGALVAVVGLGPGDDGRATA